MSGKRVLSFFKKDDCERHYKFGRTLGTGSFATVKQATRMSDNKIVAIKCIAKSSLQAEDEEALKTEVAILEKVNHPNIVKLYEIYDCPKTFYMVMELMTGGELFDRIVEKEKYTENETKKEVIQIVEAIRYCHTLGIVHRDLKPENLLYSEATAEGCIKIADFGLAKLINESALMHTACGTPGYVAPEILEGNAYEKEVDLWSVGVITYILLCGFPPFFDENNSALFEQIKKGQFDYPSPYWDCVSAEAKDFINKLLVVDPRARMTCAQALAHPWITEESSGAALSSALKELKKFNARRRFRIGVRAMVAMKAFSKIGMAAKVKKAAQEYAKGEEEAEAVEAPPKGDP